MPQYFEILRHSQLNMRHLILFITFFVILSCSKVNERLTFALEQSGKNRPELEKVLNHYKNDSLKYKSAVFLIENMPYYSYEVSPQIDSIKYLLSDIFSKNNITNEQQEKGKLLQRQNDPTIKSDIQEITSQILIENIDLAFEVWKKPWNKSLSFEDFCELILPYRIAEEPLTQWRKKYYEKYNPILDSLYKGTDVLEACNLLSDYMKTERFYYFTDFTTPRQGAEFQLTNRIGTCRDACDIATYVMRSVGIPVTTDFYPYSPEYKQGHEWNVLRDTTGKYLSFWYKQFNAVRDSTFTDERKKGKVYRMTYGMQRAFDASTPHILKNPFIKDVTAEYFGENTIEIENPKEDIQEVFLGVFTAINGWLVVDKGEVKNNKLVFKNIEPFVFYQPLFIENDELFPLGELFMYKKTHVEIFKPSDEIQKVILTRKYPLRESTAQYKKWLLGGQILAYNPNSRKKEILFSIDSLPTSIQIICNINKDKSYQYFEYISAKDKPLSIAEIHLFDKQRKEVIPKRITSNGKPWKDIHIKEIENCNDNDPLTHFHPRSTGISLFFEFQKSQTLGYFSIIPRNDDNFIRIGDTYELFYNNGSQGWISLGVQTAEKDYLEYETPKNAVLWLKNKTRGVEEQIFTYENNRQIFPTFVEYGK